MAGGYTNDAYPLGGMLFRPSVSELEYELNLRRYNSLLKYIASGTSQTVQQGPAGSGLGPTLESILYEIKNFKPAGRVTAEFDLVKLSETPSLNLNLFDQDSIHIPKYQAIVHVFGEVNNPGTLKYQPDYYISDYIQRSGGYDRFASEKEAIIISPNGDSYLANNSSFLRKRDIEIYPGSIIYIPRYIGKIEGLNYAAVVAPIFSSLAISAASLNAINSN